MEEWFWVFLGSLWKIDLNFLLEKFYLHWFILRLIILWAVFRIKNDNFDFDTEKEY